MIKLKRCEIPNIVSSLPPCGGLNLYAHTEATPTAFARISKIREIVIPKDITKENFPVSTLQKEVQSIFDKQDFRLQV
jgi:hypothetical protein